MSHNGYADGSRIIKDCKKHGAEIRYGKGDHVVVSGRGGAVVIPNREIGKGLACKILKQLAKIGIILSLVCFVIAYFNLL